jgi:hypothetical protein
MSDAGMFTSASIPPMDPNPRCETLPFQLRIWDNSNAQTAMHCPRHYWYSVVRGLRQGPPKGMDVPGAVGRPDLIFGSLIHDGADVYNKALAQGLDAEDATALALGYVLRESWPEGQVADVFGGRYIEVWQCADRTKTNRRKGIERCKWSYAEHHVGSTPDLNFDEVSADAICPACKGTSSTRIAYVCNEKYKNRRNLARAMVALCDHLTAAPGRPVVLHDGRVGSEVRWIQPLSITSPDGTPYVMTGSFDRIQNDGIRTSLGEYKTTKRQPDARYFEGLEGSPQVSTYTWAANEWNRGYGRIQVHLIVVHLGVNFCEVYQKPVHLGPASLAEWQTELEHYIQEMEIRARLAARHEAEGRDPALAYPRRLSACASLPGAPTTPCPFAGICRLDPGDREAFLANNFHVEPWSGLSLKGVGGSAENEE